MDAQILMQQSQPFLRNLVEWEASLPVVKLEDIVPHPERAAVLSVDVINAFCRFGPLASPRVDRIVPRVVRLFERAHAAGVRHLVLLQESHEPDAREFEQYGPHGVRGTPEAEAVPEIQRLPFYGQMVTIGKNSIHPALNTRLEAWLGEHPEVETFVVGGDCTDLCTYQTAMYLRLRANAHRLPHRVIVPEDAVDTYHLPVETAQAIGATPHEGDLLHLIFLHHMRLNGVEVVRSIV